MPVGDRRSTSRRFNADRRYAVRSSEIGRAQRCWCGFRAPRDAGRRPALHAVRHPALEGFARGAHFHARVVRHSRRLRVAGRFAAHARSWAALLVRVSRSRAMPVGDRRSMLYAIRRSRGSRVGLHFHSKGGAALTLAGVALLGRVSRSRAIVGGVVGAGFALTRDAGRRPALHAVRHPALEGFARGAAFSQQGWCGTHVGGGRRCWGGFRAAARCRSETGAPRGIGVGGRVVGAGFALPRDAGRRPALHVGVNVRRIRGNS